MNKICTIMMRDFKSYFTSPLAYSLIAGFLTLMGFIFFFTLDHFNTQQFQQAQMGMGGAQGVSIHDGIITPFFGNMNVILLLFVPLITMRLFAEEKKLHTIELLLTSPITLTQLVLGKFFSACLFIIVLLLVTFIYPIILIVTGNPDLGPIFTNFLGTFLLVSCYIALGVFFSSVTDNQIIAGASTFAACLFLWLVSWAAQSAGATWGDVLDYISISRHFFMSFSRGIISTTGLVYYLSFISFFLFLTQRVLDSYRWR